MSELSVISLFSGSKGNSIFVKAGNTRVLFDAGLSARALCGALRAIGESPEALDAIFITHEHSDHISALPVLTGRYPVPVHAAQPSASELHCDSALVVEHEPLFSVTMPDAEISSFMTPHDSKMSVGYIIRTDGGNVGIATDIGYISEEIYESLSRCDSIVLESNHDIGMLKNGPYPNVLKQRILSKYGHLSNKNCAEGACSLAGCGVRNILLAHLSEQNNTPELAFRETRSALDDAGYPSVRLCVADRSSPTRLI